MRREFPAKVKVAAYARAGKRCESCTAPLFPGKFAYDHIVPDALGGEPTLENCKVLCSACHGEKTAQRDVPTIAKTERIRQKHLGARVSKWPKSQWKQRVNGPPVRREEG